MSKRIIDFLALGGGHTRSIALDRDLHDDSVVSNYLLTPAAISLADLQASLAVVDLQHAELCAAIHAHAAARDRDLAAGSWM